MGYIEMMCVMEQWLGAKTFEKRQISITYSVINATD